MYKKAQKNRFTDNFQEVPQNPPKRQENPYPVLSVPQGKCS